MGCCQSNAAGVHDEDSNAQQANVASQGSLPASAAPVRSSVNAAGGSRPNHPLRQPSPIARSPKNVSNQPPPWTRSHLEKQRQEWWETRVPGSQEIWGALRQVAELLRVGDLVSAQGILDAVNVTCPTGKFSRGRGRDRNRGGVYDETGRLYDIQDWLVMDPQDIVEDTEDKIGMMEAEADSDGDDVQDADEEAARRRADKGKGRAASPGEETMVKVRCSDGVPDLEVVFGAKQNVSAIAAKVRELRQKESKVTLFFMGKPLDEKQTLEAQAWQPGKVLNAFVKDDEAAT